jgi:transposase-like protein
VVDGKELLQVSGVNDNFWNRFIVPSVLILKGTKCECCGSNENVDVHHTRYDVQTLETLLVLCRSCHRNWHSTNGSATHLLKKYGTTLSEASQNIFANK